MDLTKYSLTKDETSQVFVDAVNACPEAFYLTGGYSYYSNASYVTYLNIEYKYDMSTISVMKNQYDEAVSKIVEMTDSNWSDMEKALFINDYLATHCEYDTDYNNYNAYNVFVDGKAVCQGYALAYKELADELGLDCTVITSTSLNHAWNMVTINGKQYMIDATWNDPLYDLTGRARHVYFMKSLTYFKANGHNATDYITGIGYDVNAATDTSYDSYFWNELDTAFAYCNGYWFNLYDYKITMFQYSNGQLNNMGVNNTISTALNGYAFHEQVAAFDGKIYIMMPLYIMEYDMGANTTKKIYTVTDEQRSSIGYMWGFTIMTNGVVKADFRDDNNTTKTIVEAVTLVNSGATVAKTYDNIVVNLPNINGGTTSTAANGKPKMIVFTKSGCGNCTYNVNQLKGKDLSKIDVMVCDISRLNMEQMISCVEKEYPAIDKSQVSFCYDASSVCWQLARVFDPSISLMYTPMTVYINANNKIVHYTYSYDSNVVGTIAQSLGVVLTDKAATTYPISSATITLSSTSFEYDGTEKKPEVTVEYNNRKLVLGTDYTLTYSNNTQVGTGKVVITGKGDFTGAVEKSFSITKTGQTVTAVASSNTVSCNGKVTISANGVGTITYSSSNTNIATVTSSGIVTGVGEGTVIITVSASGDANTKASSTTITLSVESCEISAPATDISKCTVTLSESSFTYDGNVKKPTVTVKNGTTTLKQGTDYIVNYTNNVDAGNASVAVTGTGNYTGTVSKAYVINKADNPFEAYVSSFEVSCNSTEMFYVTGVGTVTYTSENEEIATVSADGVITGISDGTVGIVISISGDKNYNSDSIKAYITVIKCEIEQPVTNISTCNISVALDGIVYDGTAKKPAINIDNNGYKLVEGTDYTVAYSNNVNVGTAKVTITGIGYYDGTVERSFYIDKADQNIEIIPSAYEIECGKTVTLSVSGVGTITYKSNDTSVATVTSQGVVSGVKEGIASITVTASGNGNTKASSSTIYLPVQSCEISADDTSIEGFSIALTQTKYEYDGTAKKPEVTVYNASKLLTKDTDYSVSYSNNINVGTATVKVTGKGKYTGTVTKYFKIDKADQVFIVSIDNSNICIGDTTTIRAYVEDETKLSYASDNTSVVTVSSTGTVKALKEGIAKITVTLAGDANHNSATKSLYVSVTDCTIGITEVNISNCNIELDKTVYTYTGSAIKPTVVIRNEGTKLVSGTDYTVAYSNNTNAGTATITITGKGGYTGTATKTFTITKKSQSMTASASESVLYVNETSKITTSSVKGTVTYKSSDTTIATVSSTGVVTAKKTGDVVITVSAAGDNNNEPVTAYVAIYVIDEDYSYGDGGDYDYGDDDFTFDIAKECTVKLSGTSFTYTGSAIKPKVTVEDVDLGELELGEDYTVTYSNNVNVGTATVVVKGMGIFSGTITKKFTITEVKKTSLSDLGATITLSGASFTYTGSQQKPTVTVSYTKTVNVASTYNGYDDYDLDDDDDYDWGDDDDDYDWGDDDDELYDIKTDCTVTLSGTSFTYTGKAITPTVTVIDKDINEKLVANVDYTVKYTNNINVGTATVTVTGIGDYTGTVNKSFTIKSATTTQTIKLVEGTDYKVTYSNNVNAGTAKVTVTGIGKYEGTLYKTYTIKAASIAKYTATLSKTTYAYTGSALKPTVTVKNGTKVFPVKDSTGRINYTVTYSGNVNIGTAKVTITGKGNYTGTIAKTFTINPKTSTGLKAAAASYNSIKLTWTKDATVTGYQIYRSTSKTGSYTKVGTVTRNTTYTYVDKSSIKTGTPYYYKIRAYKTVSGMTYYGGFSAIVTAKTALGKATISSVKTTAVKTLTVTWGRVAGATGYIVYRANSANGTYSKIATVGNVTQYVNKGLVKNKTYYYKVVAYIRVGTKNVLGAASAIKYGKVTR